MGPAAGHFGIRSLMAEARNSAHPRRHTGVSLPPSSHRSGSLAGVLTIWWPYPAALAARRPLRPRDTLLTDVPICNQGRSEASPAPGGSCSAWCRRAPRPRLARTWPATGRRCALSAPSGPAAACSAIDHGAGLVACALQVSFLGRSCELEVIALSLAVSGYRWPALRPEQPTSVQNVPGVL